jgi:hypothetical protein
VAIRTTTRASGTPLALSTSNKAETIGSLGTGRVMSLTVIATDAGPLRRTISARGGEPTGSAKAARTAAAGSASAGTSGPFSTTAESGSVTARRPVL